MSNHDTPGNDPKGYVWLHRSIQNNRYYFQERFSRIMAWIDLLLIANHSPGYIRKRGIEINLQRGQVGFSQETLADRWQWSRGKVARFLDELEADNQISRKTIQQNSRLTTLLQITNYDYYNSDRSTNGQQTDNKRYRNKNDKNDEKEKKKYSDAVRLTEKEYLNLVERIGQEDTTKAIDILNNYKMAKGRNYKSDYHAILSWVIKRIKEDDKYNGRSEKRDKGCSSDGQPYPTGEEFGPD